MGYICPDVVNVTAPTRSRRDARGVVSVEASGPEDGDLLPDPSGIRDVIVSGLGGGTYAFTCQGPFERDDPEFESYGEPSDEIVFAAQFVFDAPPVELTPADETAERRREGYADASDLGGSERIRTDGCVHRGANGRH